MTTIKLSLMCKSHDYRLIDQSSNTFRTSSWQMSQKKASSLIGESVTLTESKNKCLENTQPCNKKHLKQQKKIEVHVHIH